MTITKKELIIKFSRKHPHWQREFLRWLKNDDNLDVIQLKSTFNFFLTNKDLLKDDIDIKYAEALTSVNDDIFHTHFGSRTIINVVEIFNDAIHKNLHTKKKQQFISSLKTEKYSHLFNKEVESEIHVILDNKVSIAALKHQFFNKLARFSNARTLLLALTDFKIKHIGWYRENYLNKINEYNLNVNIIQDENNELMIQVLDYTACAALGASSWCIVDKEHYFNQYTSRFNRQFIYLNFNLPLESNYSLIGFTVDTEGVIKHSHLKNDDATSKIRFNEFNFKKLSHIEIDLLLKKVDKETAFKLICQHGWVDFFDSYFDTTYVNDINVDLAISANCQIIVDKMIKFEHINHFKHFNKAIILKNNEIALSFFKIPNIDFSKEDNISIIYAARHGLTDIFHLLLAIKEVDPSTKDNSALLLSSKCGHYKILKTLLSDPRVDPTAKDGFSIVNACIAGHTKIIELLLNDGRVNPIGDDNDVLTWASKLDHVDIMKLLIADDRVANSISNEWVRDNIKEKYYCLFDMG
jgi:hypothetical protein